MKLVSTFSVPAMICLIILFGLHKKVKIYDAFLSGVQEGMKMALNIAPALIAIITAVTMFRASGALDVICKFLSPVADFLSFPSEVLPLVILRPISGSASLALVKDMLVSYCPDSTIGRIVSVVAGSTETTLYTIAVYFGSVKIKDSRHTLKSGLLADFTSFVFAVITVKLLLN